MARNRQETDRQCVGGRFGTGDGAGHEPRHLGEPPSEIGAGGGAGWPVATVCPFFTSHLKILGIFLGMERFQVLLNERG